MPSIVGGGAASTSQVFAWLRDAGLTRAGVPVALGGTGAGRTEALREVLRLQRMAPAAAAVLASHQGVIGALLAGRNVGLRHHRLPALTRGDIAGIWPSSAIEDMLQRGSAAVQALDDGHGPRLTGPLGRVDVGDLHPVLILCPVQWSSAHPPGLALLDGEQDGLRFAALPQAARGDVDTKLASLDNLRFEAATLIDEDGPRIALEADLQALHAIVRRWLAWQMSTHSVPTRSSTPDDRG